MLAVGLTGGIGSGKSRVSDAFARLGVPVIDTDIIARELVAPGQPALDEIRAAFGNAVFTAEGELDRRALRQRIFSQPDQRRKLEAILHPRIRAEVRRQIAALSAPWVLVVIPLLLESGQGDLVQRVLVVDAPVELQRARTTQRDQISDEEVDRILAAQLSREQRLAAADDVIVNDGSLADLQQQVEKHYHFYNRLAGGCQGA
ncbi:MAG TPA: dephospho-CoA kinase [Gammaproteobacteria bacterium]|nr:dephospho-CoA kinase [Gammaproteobacteria bacterium]